MTPAQRFLNQLYDEGHFSEVSFFHLMDNIDEEPAYRSADALTCNARSLRKSRQRTLEDTLKVVAFMMREGDFEAYFYGNIFEEEISMHSAAGRRLFSLAALRQSLRTLRQHFQRTNYPHRPNLEIKTFTSFEKIVRDLHAHDPKLFARDLNDIPTRPFHITLAMARKVMHAPPVTPDIERIFHSPPSRSN